MGGLPFSGLGAIGNALTGNLDMMAGLTPHQQQLQSMLQAHQMAQQQQYLGYGTTTTDNTDPIYPNTSPPPTVWGPPFPAVMPMDPRRILLAERHYATEPGEVVPVELPEPKPWPWGRIWEWFQLAAMLGLVWVMVG
jgi:hypothetical protein